jgi:hypothetical protein
VKGGYSLRTGDVPREDGMLRGGFGGWSDLSGCGECTWNRWERDLEGGVVPIIIIIIFSHWVDD